MSDKPDHVRLFIPGPIEVRKEILEEQGRWMIGHRGSEFEKLFASMQSKLRQVFYTKSRVFVSTSSGTGLWEGASRNCIRDDKKVLHLVNGAFSERWAKVILEGSVGGGEQSATHSTTRDAGRQDASATDSDFGD